MATDAVTVSPTFNGDSVSLTAGMIVRLKPGANNNVVRAQASTSAGVQAVNGVVVSGSSAPTGSVVIACVGRETVQMESGLTPNVGDTVYVSPNAAGKGTNVVPGLVYRIGTIVDVSNYGRTTTVVVAVNIAASTNTAGASPGESLTVYTPIIDMTAPAASYALMPPTALRIRAVSAYWEIKTTNTVSVAPICSVGTDAGESNLYASPAGPSGSWTANPAESCVLPAAPAVPVLADMTANGILVKVITPATAVALTARLAIVCSFVPV